LTELLALAQESDLEQSLTGELKEHWKNLDTQKLQDEVNWSAKYKHIIDIARSTESFDHASKSKVIRLPWLKAAVAIILIVGAALMVWNAGLPEKQGELASAVAPASRKTACCTAN
jgi:hypothetical protein